MGQASAWPGPDPDPAHGVNLTHPPYATAQDSAYPTIFQYAVPLYESPADSRGESVSLSLERELGHRFEEEM